MSKIRRWSLDAHLNAVSGVVEKTSSSIISETIPEIFWISLKFDTTPLIPMELPLTSQTRNFAGTVLRCLNTLDPSELIGRRISCPGSPMHTSGLYRTFSVALVKVRVRSEEG